MKSAALLLLLSSIVFAGCTATKKVAVSTFRVLDTPHRYIRERIDPPETTTTTTTTTESSDVVMNPGRPIEPTPPPTRSTAAPRATPRPSRSTAGPPAGEPRGPAATPRPRASTAAQFPTARPVPGRPGYVYSVDPNGGIVDVTGYKPGDKAKDPYTQQIFIVP